MMSDRMERGYVISGEEVAAVLISLGRKDLCGLPCSISEDLTVERAAQAFRELVRKGILTWGKGAYYLSAPFDEIFRGMKESTGSVRLFSNGCHNRCWITYPIGNGMIAAWKITASNAGRSCVFYADADEFVRELREVGFMPELCEYCENIPETFGSKLIKQIGDIENGNDGLNSYTILLACARDGSGESKKKYIAVSRSPTGAVLSQIDGDECSSVPYSTEAACRALAEFITEV